MSQQERHERVALNESRFREINDRVREELEALHTQPQWIRFVCECGRLDCRQQIELTPRGYEGVRADPMLFAIVPGHEIPDAEDVVERTAGYVVVRKHADVEEIVRSTDPRA